MEPMSWTRVSIELVGARGTDERRAGGREDTKFMSVELADVREQSL